MAEDVSTWTREDVDEYLLELESREPFVA